MVVWVYEYDTTIACIDKKTKEQLLNVSESTISRFIKEYDLNKPGWSKGNKRSGRSAENKIKKNIHHASVKTIMACNVPPGDIQIDTFALGGGIASDNFFWILDSTDRKTQWTNLSPTWNREREATLVALKHIATKIPFPINAIHCDNGGEILNHHVLAYLGKKINAPYVWSSRPRKCNDNAYVEGKNSSCGRQLFGEIRLDNYALLEELIVLCDEWSNFRNFFCPCKMLISKEEMEASVQYLTNQTPPYYLASVLSI